MHLKSLLLFFILFPIIAFSQNTVTLTASKSSMGENESMEIVATTESPAEKDIIIDFELSGKALHFGDFMTEFPTKGTPTTIGAGRGDGPNQFFKPSSIFIDKDDNIYVAEPWNNRVQKWAPGATEGIRIIEGFYSDVFIDSEDNIYLVSSHQVKKLSPGATVAITVAGKEEPGSKLDMLYSAKNIFVDESGQIYIADSENHRVQKWLSGATTGTIVAGGIGPGFNSNQLIYPYDVIVDKHGDLYVSDLGNHRIQKWAPGSIEGINIIGGKNEWGDNLGQLNEPHGITLDHAGNVLVADFRNNRVQLVNPQTSVAITIAGGTNGSGQYQLSYPTDVCIDTHGNLYVADSENHRIQKYQLAPQILIKAGETTGKLVINGIDDLSNEVNEDFIFTPCKITNGTLSSDYTLNIELIDNDIQPVISFQLSSDIISENSSTEVTLTANVSQVSGKDIQIDFTIGGEATEFLEYILSSKSINIPAGRNSGSLTISTRDLDDSSIEILESIVFNVSSIVNATTEHMSTTMMIESDDDPTVTFETLSSTFWEYESNEIIATLSAPTSKDVLIDIELTGTAKNYVDFKTEFPTQGNIETVCAWKGYPYIGGLTVDDFGNLYISDNLHRVQKWAPGEVQGITIAGGNGSGLANNQLYNPREIIVDTQGNLFIADYNNGRVQKWAHGAKEGVTVAGGNGYGTNANQLSAPSGIFIDSEGIIFIADQGNDRIQKWTLGSTTGTTVAGGNGYGPNPNMLHFPYDVVVDNVGNLYISDQDNHRIQKWAPNAKEGITVAGGYSKGKTSKLLASPRGIALDHAGNIIIADSENHRIQKWAPGAIEGVTIAGGNLAGSNFNQLNFPIDVCIDKKGDIYVADYNNSRVQKVRQSPQILIKAGDISGKLIITAIDDKSSEENENIVILPGKIINATAGTFDPLSIELKDDDIAPVVTFVLSNNIIPENSSTDVTLTAKVSVIAGKDININFVTEGTASETLEYVLSSKSILIPTGKSSGILTISTKNLDDSLIEILETIRLKVGSIVNAVPKTESITIFIESDDAPKVSLAASLSTIGEHQATDIIATLESPTSKDVIIDFAFAGSAKHYIDFTTEFLTKGKASAIGLGQGTGSQQFTNPSGVSVDKGGNIYVADENNSRVQKWAPGATEGQTVARGALSDVFVDLQGNIYVSDFNNNSVQKWTPGATSGITVAGGNGRGSAPNQLYYPTGIFVDNLGQIFVADQLNHRVQKWAPGASSGVTVAGGNGFGSRLDQLSNPHSVVVDQAGNVFVSDQVNYRIQKWAPGAKEGVTVAGGSYGSNANQLIMPRGISLDNSGNLLIADAPDNSIKSWFPGATQSVIVAGGALANYPNKLNFPNDVSVDKEGNVYVADTYNHRIQKYQFGAQIVIRAGTKTGKYTINGILDELNPEGDELIEIGIKSIVNGISSSDPLSIKIVDVPFVKVNDVKLPRNLISYPNPTTGVISINIPGTYTNATMIIRDIMGAIVYKKAFGILNERKLETDISNLNNGIYTITIETNNERYMSKVVKM